MNYASIIGIALWALIPGFIAKKKGRSFWGYYFLSFVITPLISMIVTLCLSSKVADANDEVVATVSVEEVITSEPEIVESSKANCCKHCGAELIEGSEFCSSCGSKVE